MWRRLLIIAVLVLEGAAASASASDRQHGEQQLRAPPERQRGSGRVERPNHHLAPLTVVRQNALNNYPGGQFMNARLVETSRGGQLAYRVVINHRGRRVEALFDAYSGHFLREVR